MPSGPTTSLDLGAADVAADPYPFFAEERARHAVAFSERAGMWLTFDHAAAGAVLRSRSLGRLWSDREPAARLEPFNLLHRNQMMENEGVTHTRLRRPVAWAFGRGHVERLRPRVRELAEGLLDGVSTDGPDGPDGPDGSDGFDVVGAYAEPLPVLVIAELLGVPDGHVDDLRRWSQAVVRMYEVAPSDAVVAAAVAAAEEFAAFVVDLIAARRAGGSGGGSGGGGGDLLGDLVTTELSDDEIVAAVVLLLNAGHEASVNVFGNGLAAMLARGLRPGTDVGACVEEMLRFDSALQLFERTATADVEIGGVRIAAGERIAALLGAANRDPAVFDAPDAFRPDRTPNLHLAFGAGVHFCLGSPLARMELAESVEVLFSRFPDLALDGEPVSRGTFVLRGYESVRVRAGR